MRGKIVLTAFVVFGFVLAGCNTMAGMGKDVSRAGNAITNAAEVSRRPPRPLSWTRPQSPLSGSRGFCCQTERQVRARRPRSPPAASARRAAA